MRKERAVVRSMQGLTEADKGRSDNICAFEGR